MPPIAIERHAPLVRFVLYAALGVWSLLLFVFCIIRLVYTTQHRNERSLNNGDPFYDPSVVELFVCSVLGAALSFVMLRNLRYRSEHEVFSRNWFEVVSLAVLWLLWLGGTAAATGVWPDLNTCIQYFQCRMLQALLAWTWLGWITITALLLPTVWLVATARNWDDHSFDLWGERKGGFAIPMSGLKRDRTKKSTSMPPPAAVPVRHTDQSSPVPSVKQHEPPMNRDRGIAGGEPQPTMFQNMMGRVFRKKPPPATSDPRTTTTHPNVAAAPYEYSPDVPTKDSAVKGKNRHDGSEVTEPEVEPEMEHGRYDREPPV